MALFIGLFVFCLIWITLSVAFNVSIGVAFLILLGIAAVAGAVYYFIRKANTEKKKKIITIVAIAVLIVFCLFVLVRCTGFVVEDFKNGSGDNTQWSSCLGCGGDGRTDFGSKCTRCGGVGKIPY